MGAMTSSQPPSLIQEPLALEALADVLHRQPYIALDTESNSLYAYQEQVCLIQFSTSEQDYLVDPLALPDLEPLTPIIADPKVEKILHGGEYDVMCLKRDFGFQFANLFDTHIACRTLGWEKTGLRDILARVFDVHVSKRYQRANWGARPLREEMMDYARLDTRYLIPLRHKLADELKQADRWEEALEGFKQLTMVDPHDNGFDPEKFWRIRYATKLNPSEAAILRELYLYRDTQARGRDLPPFKVMGDKTLLVIARAAPSSKKALRKLHGMTSGQVRRYGDGLLKAVARGRQAPKQHPPSAPRTDEAVKDRYEALHTWRKRRARARGVESDIIVPRDLLWEIAHANPQEAQSLKRLMKTLPWRFEHYGREILDALYDETSH
jgi:ribonuclease D